MAAPILKIPIDDEAFNRFLESFKKYQKSVGQQSEVWGEVNSSIKELASSGVDFVSSIEEQIDATRKLSEQEDKRARALRDAAAKHKKEQEDEKKRQDEISAKRKQSINQIRDYGKTLGDVAASLGKIGVGPQAALGIVGGASEGLGAASSMLGGAGGGLAAGLGGAAAIGAGALAVVGGAGYAAYELAERNADLQRRAGGLGISTGELQGSHIYQNRLFDTESAMDRIMRMKYDVTQRGPLYAMGVRPEGKDAAQLLTEISMKAKGLTEKHPENFLTYAHALGYDKILSAEDLMRIKGSTREQIIKYGKDAADFAKLHGNTKDQNDRLTDFKNNVDAVSTAFTNNLVPATLRVTDAFNALVKSMGQQNPEPSVADSTISNIAKEGLIASGPAGLAAAFASKFVGKIQSYVFGNGGAAKINQTQELKTASKAFPELERKYGLNAGTLDKIAQIESSGGKRAGLSPKGALGAFQFMPGTAMQYGITNRADINQEAVATARYMHDLLRQFHGDETAAIAAFNEGPGNVRSQMKRYHENWLSHAPKETRDYVAKYNPGTPAEHGHSGKPVKVSLNVTNTSGTAVAITANSAKTAAMG